MHLSYTTFITLTHLQKVLVSQILLLQEVNRPYADEAKKCIMLCANCHRRIENGLISLDDFTPILFDEEKYFKTLEDLIS